jgi:hypothetical protein
VHRVLSDAGIVRVQLGQEHSSGHNEKWAFTVVRNPINWWASVWRFQHEHGWPSYNDAAHPLHEIGKIPECDLQDWMDYAVTKLPGLCGHIFHDFTSRCKYVLSMEYLSADMVKLSALVGWGDVDFNKPMVNASKSNRTLGLVETSELEKAEQQAFAIWRKAGL